MDLIIRNARLADRSSAELSDIGVGNGRIVAIERRLAADAEVYDAEGRLACPGLIESQSVSTSRASWTGAHRKSAPS
jgi:cytosine/creatinine deaminase